MQYRAQLAGARLLLVEDNEVSRELALEWLKAAGLSVDVAADGRQALDKLATGRYDAVLMDCQMPVMDGFAATRALRERPGLKDLPVIAMTADGIAGEREQAMAAGMNDQIAKPIDFQQMLATLGRWIAPPSAASDLHSLPGIDAADALQRVGDSEALLRKLLLRFLQAHRDFVPRFDATWAAGDQAEARRLAHDLQSTAGTLGMTVLRQKALALEQACIAGDAAALPQRLEQLSTALDPVLQGLARWAEGPGGAPGRPG